MSSFITELRPRRRAPSLGSAEARERWVHRRVGITWGLLFLNTLTFSSGTWNSLPLIVPIPTPIGKLLTQGALPVALLIALTVNRRIVIRPNVFLCLLSLLVVEEFVAGLHPAGHVIGTLYRTFRLAGFVATLWLLTPWWGRRDMLLVKYQLISFAVVLGTVLLGLFVAPGRALAGGRLSGEFWPMPPTKVADLAAATLGLVIMMWLSGTMRGRASFAAVAVTAPILLLTHTRIELIAMLAGILVGGLSLFISRARVRKSFVAAAIGLSVGITIFSGVLTTWLARGQSSQELGSLTGRTTVWAGVVNAPRDQFQVIFGYGLSNKSFNGLPIDSNWLATYYDLGLFGVFLCVALVVFVFTSAYFQPRGPQRALALFIVTYLAVTSLTETGLSDASTFLLLLALAASLLVPPITDWRPQ